MASTGLIDRVVRPHVAAREDAYLNSKNVSGVTESFLPQDMPSGVSRIVTSVLNLFEARNMSEHCVSMPLLAKDVVWDAPPFLLSRKGSVRVSAYLSKFIARQRFVPFLVQVESIGLSRSLIEVSGTLQLFPTRTIFVPASLLLPSVIPIRATLTIGVAGGNLDSGAVELVALKFHNLPTLPNFLRALNGMAFGVVPHLMEPLWSYLPEFIGDDFYRRRRERTFAARHPNSSLPLVDAAKDAVVDTSQGIIDYGVDSVHNAFEGANYLYSNLMEALGYAFGRARATASHAANLASDVASTAADTATRVTQTAYNTAAGVAGAAYDTAAGVAGTAYDTAATAAGTAVEAGRQTVDAGRATAERAQVRVAEGVDVAATRAQEAADDARRGYEKGKHKPVHVEAPVTTTRAPAGVSSY